MSSCPSPTLPQDTKLTEKKSFDLAALKLKVRRLIRRAAARSVPFSRPAVRLPHSESKGARVATGQVVHDDGLHAVDVG